MLQGLRTAIQEHRKRAKARPFLESCMATCALVAIADGDVSLSERSRVDQVLETIDRLQLFDVHEAIDLFNGYVDAIIEDPDEGRAKALKAVREMRSDAPCAVLLVKIALAISNADGEFLESELVQCYAICAELGLSLEDYMHERPTVSDIQQ